MMKKYILAISTLICAVACNDGAVYEKEMYKHVFALVSSGEWNIYEETHQLNGGESIGYVAASCGGTEETTRDLEITLEEDASSLEAYNKSNFDADVNRYARLLGSEHYSIDNYKIRIPAGKRSGKMMIRVRPDGLSPDSTYFISLRATSHSAYEANPKRSNVFYRVVIENDYASQATTSRYKMEGIKSTYDNQGGVSTKQTASDKIMHPIAWNKVRIMAGDEPFQSDITAINRAAIVLEITADNRVRITPFGDIVVRTLADDTDYPNTFHQETTPEGLTFKVFRLNYEYWTGNSHYSMREELRMQVMN